MEKKMRMFRHGDVILREVKKLPVEATEKDGLTLALGEVTGHSHRFEPGCAKLMEFDSKVYARVRGGLAALVHEEHKRIDVPEGDYEIMIQEDYTPIGWTKVID